MFRTRFLLALVLSAAALPAFAQDQIVDVPACTFMCHLWRNLSGRVQGPVEAPATGAIVAEQDIPAVTDGATAPRPDRIVKERGVVALETPAERSARLRQRAALEKKLTATDFSTVRGAATGPVTR